MNSSPSHSDPVIDEQAAYWAARLDGDVLDAADRVALDAWLAQSPAHRAALSDYCQFSADLEEQLPSLVASGAVKLPAAERPARRWFTLPRLASVGLAAAALAVAVTWFARAEPHIENLATAVAQRSAATLADGTRVELNAHTSLRFENTADERRVRLTGGEALFAVARDHSRPFIVETPSGAVRVTGTTFNVRNEPGTATPFEVTVVEGSVEVRAAEPLSAQSAPHSLTANEQLSASANGVVKRELSAEALADALAWREGRIVFEGVPLEEVAARLGRYHGRRIAVDPAITQEKVGGIYSLDNFHAFLAALEGALPVKAHVDELSGAVSLRARPGS